MLKLTNFEFFDNILKMVVLIEGDESRAYEICVDTDSEMFDIVQSDIPDEYRIYERQAQMALREYDKQHNDLPESITSAWC